MDAVRSTQCLTLRQSSTRPRLILADLPLLGEQPCVKEEPAEEFEMEFGGEVDA